MIRRIIRKLGFDIVLYKNVGTSYNSLLNKQVSAVDEILCLFEKVNGEPLLRNDKRNTLLTNLIGTTVSEAISILYAIQSTKDVHGDICEFGVAQGATSALMANEILAQNAKSIWLFDSFEGLPMPTEKDLLKDDIFNLGSMGAYAGLMSYGVGHVKQRLDEISFPANRVNIIPGFIENTINIKQLPKKVSFAYVDFDFYEPIQIALDYLHGVTDVGAKVIVDDYDWFSTGAKTAVDEFMVRHEKTYELNVPDKRLGHFAMLTKVR